MNCDDIEQVFTFVPVIYLKDHPSLEVMSVPQSSLDIISQHRLACGHSEQSEDQI